MNARDVSQARGKLEMMEVRADEIAWGFVARRPPATQQPGWVLIESAELEDDAFVQFCRVRVRDDPPAARGDFCILTRSTLPQAKASVDAVALALCRTYRGTRVVVPLAEQTGLIELHAIEDAPSELVGAAAAISRASGSWDESDPFVAKVGAVTFHVRAAFDGQFWRAQVEAG